MTTGTSSSFTQDMAGKSVLIVDDDPETMLFVVRAFRERHLSVRIETHLRDAFERLNQDAERQKIGLVIVDLQFIGQELPAALLESRRTLGGNATANNTGQALGYWLWQQKSKQPEGWPRYVYTSISPSFWQRAEKPDVQEFGSGEEIQETFVLGKLLPGGEEFCAALEKAWDAWTTLEAHHMSRKAP